MASSSGIRVSKREQDQHLEEVEGGKYAERKRSRGAANYATNNESEPVTPTVLSIPVENSEADDHLEAYSSSYQCNLGDDSTPLEFPTQPLAEGEVATNESLSTRTRAKKTMSKKNWRQEYFDYKREETERYIQAQFEVQRLKAKFKMAKKGREREVKNEFSTERCMEIYNDFPGFDVHDDDKINTLFQDIFQREFFLSLAAHKRAGWLRVKLDKM